MIGLGSEEANFGPIVRTSTVSHGAFATLSDAVANVLGHWNAFLRSRHFHLSRQFIGQGNLKLRAHDFQYTSIRILIAWPCILKSCPFTSSSTISPGAIRVPP